LEGTPWRLQSYTHKGRTAAPGPEVAATLRLASGRFDATGGCSRIKGAYSTLGSAISFRPGRVKPPTCAEQSAIVQLAVVSGLRKAAAFELVAAGGAADQLVLRSTSGEELLRFGLDDVASLEGSTWTLAVYVIDGIEQPASSEQTAILTFIPERNARVRRRSSGQVTGSTGCNGIVADYARQADVLSLGELELTDAPCTPDLAAQESAMTRVLDATALWVDLPNDRLTLHVSDGDDRLELVRARPLEGSTWIHRGPPRQQDPTARVTLRLQDGVASGEGPCGTYSAEYATDGVFMTFRGVRGAGDDTCDEAAAEKRWLEALRDTVALDRNGDMLRLMDVRRRTLLRFELPGVG
jgi:heat shock protein HslJ